MKLIWIGYIIEILILSLIKPYVTNFEGVAIIAVLIHVIFSMVILYLSDRKIKHVIILGYLARVFVLFWDLYARNIYSLPNSGADTEMFYRMSVLISNNLSMIGTTNGGMYSNILGIIFSLIGPQRVFGQYLNVLLGISTVFMLYKILENLDINTKVKRSVIFIATFFPNSIVFSAIFLREISPTFFVSVSLYFYIKWFKDTHTKNILLAFLFLGLASTFHSGVVGISLGYIFAYLFYKKESNNFKFSANTILAFIIIVTIFILSFTVLKDFIFGKFLNVEDIDDIFETATSSGAGGSAYLTGLEINNPGQFILFIPIKSIYFLFSPFPWDWRGVFDIFTFLFDSMLYMITIYNIVKNIKLLRKKPLTISLVLMLLGAVLIFATGVSNTGTAMRHRQKLLPVILMLLGIIINLKFQHKTISK